MHKTNIKLKFKVNNEELVYIHTRVNRHEWSNCEEKILVYKKRRSWEFFSRRAWARGSRIVKLCWGHWLRGPSRPVHLLDSHLTVHWINEFKLGNRVLISPTGRFMRHMRVRHKVEQDSCCTHWWNKTPINLTVYVLIWYDAYATCLVTMLVRTSS